jgi:hypothetical protein
MQRVNYFEFSGFGNIYLEDSFVLEVNNRKDYIDFLIDVVLTEKHSFYVSPKPEEQFCYRRASISFSEVLNFEWENKLEIPFTDANGEKDYGSINFLYYENGLYVIEGDLGMISIVSSPPILKILNE